MVKKNLSKHRSNRISKLFCNQLDRIKDKKLADKVVQCWVKAVNQTNYNVNDLENLPFTLALDGRRTDINLIEHTIAVTEAAYSMAKVEKQIYGNRKSFIPVNWDYLVAGGLLHDVGKLVEIEPSKDYFQKSRLGKCLRHPGYGAAIAYSCGIPNEILNTIANHSREGDERPRTKEARLVMHADFAFYEAIKEPFE